VSIAYVGGQVAGRAGIASTASITFALTGGLESTPAVGDLVIITAVVGSQARNPAQAISGYTAIGQLNPTAQTYDTSMDVSWKFLTTAETTFTLPSTGNIADAQRYTVQVFRGIDPGANISALAASDSATGTSRCNPASVTPTVAGSWVVICGGGAAATGANYTAPANFTTNFLTGSTADTNDALVGSGYWDGWTSGAVDPAVYTGGSTATTSSWAAYTLVIPPAVAPAITLDPVDQSEAEGTTATFTVAGTGTPTPTVQWQVLAP
jgi:large repetitive protein